jgi:hypothetical protein
MKKIFFFLLIPCQLIYSQIEGWEIEHPLKSVTTLSGNYAELRRHHFHGGLDFRTGGVENVPVCAIDEGYISKISISPRGYGKLAYINHPNGYTTLYAHLNGFTSGLDSIVREKQYEKRSFEIEISFQPDEYPVKKGEQFALSGNTGSSGGPHLHFEVRKTDDHTLLNPLYLNNYFKVEDDRPPRILAVKIYGMNDNGIINNGKEKKFQVAANAAKTRTLQGGSDIKAWGEIGFSVKARDYMTGTHFTHTPRIIKLYVDDNLISEVNINNIKYSDSRALNSFIDYSQWMRSGEFYMKSFPDANSPLTIFTDTKYQGIYHITEERPYAVRYEVYDDFELQDAISFTIQGKKTEIPKNRKMYVSYLPCKESHVFDQQDFLIHFPENALYTDLGLEYKKTASPKFCSDVHSIGDPEIPLHSFCDITIKINKDTVEDKGKYFIAKLNPNNIITGSAGGVYVNGFMVGKTNAFDKFAVAADTQNPIITPVNTTDLHRRPYLRFKILDALSGIARYDGYIDNEWILFEYDAKSHTITHKIDRVKQNKNHKFKLVVTDMCGNSETFEKTIYW